MAGLPFAFTYPTIRSYHQDDMSLQHHPAPTAETSKIQDDDMEEIKHLEDDLTTPYDSEHDFNFTLQQQKKIIRRIDWRVVVVLGAMYTTSLIDRSNIGIAFISGMGTDLELNGYRYNIINAVFFGPYILLQFPATILLRAIGPRTFLCSTTMLWGLTNIACGFVRNWYDLVALRVVLGICEAAFFPGCNYLLSLWYPRYDLNKRYAVFNIIGTIPSAFSGVGSYGISHLAGHGVGPTWWSQHHSTTGRIVAGTGVAGWRYIFWVYGALTCAVGIVAWLFTVDFPEKIVLGTGKQAVPFLSQKEAAWAVERIHKDRKDVMPAKFHLREYLRHCGDWKIWALSFCYGCNAGAMYAIALATPFILTEGMHFQTGAAQCLSTPPYLAGALASLLVGYYSDKCKMRSPFIVVSFCIEIIGLCLIGFTHNVGLRYFGIFAAACGGIAGGPCIQTFLANNVRGQWKRAMSSAMLSVFSALGGLVGSFIFRTADAPYYHPGIIACLVAVGLIIVLILLLDLVFIKANRRAQAGMGLIEGLEGFRYTL